MALCSDAAMVLFYDVEGDTSDHDDWHSHEHFHERLSVPGFRRATRWVARDAGPRYLVIYEVSDVGVATSQAYLDRLDNPSPWTSEMMPRFRGMVRGFCHVTAGAGFGLGAMALTVRFTPDPGRGESLSDWLRGEVVPAMASGPGLVSVHLLRPAPPPPMTREQALRGPDEHVPWMLVATGYDEQFIARAAERHSSPELLRQNGASGDIDIGSYALHYTAVATEADRAETAGAGPGGARAPRRAADTRLRKAKPRAS